MVSIQSTLTGDLKNSIFDGIFANMFATLTGGLFLTGLALYLGMNEFMIGLLSAMPFLTTLFQLPTSYYLGIKNRRKAFTTYGALAARLIWLPILVIAVIPGLSVFSKSIVVLLLIFISQSFMSISFVSWLSWISDIVPDRIRGRFFGTRNMLCGAAGMAVMIIFGNLLDFLKSREMPAWGFSLVFILAVVFGLQSVYFLKKISDPFRPTAPDMPVPFRTGIFLPFKDTNFRKFLVFACTWSFSVYFASPFFTLYFLRELQFSYAFVAFLGSMAALSDLLGMHFWGRISDKVKNKAVIQVASWVVVFLPLAWAMVRPESRFIPILLHIVGGGFWAGINLCMNNLLFTIAPRENKPFYLAAYNIIGGLGAAAGPIMAGLVLGHLDGLSFEIARFQFVPLQLVFLTSTILRVLSSRLLLRKIIEPEAVEPVQLIRVVRNIRALNIASGFNHLLHPFVETFKEIQSDDADRVTLFFDRRR